MGGNTAKVQRLETDVAIVGGGVIGLTAALELADAGLAVILVERRVRGREASRAAGGILSPVKPWDVSPHVNAMAAWSQARYPALAERLRAASGVDPEYRRCGLLMLDCRELDAARAWAEGAGQDWETLDAADVRTLEPRLEPGEGTALRLPGVAQLRNPRLVEALGRTCEAAGVRLVEYPGECGPVVEDGRAVGVATGRGMVRAKRVLVAAGAWSGRLLEHLGLACPVRPVRGQMLHYRLEPGTLGHITMTEGRYLIARKDGNLIVGSTLEEAGFDKSVTAAAARDLHRAAVKVLPALARAPILGQWAGLRPWAPDGVPLIGRVPGVDGLWVSAGHYRNGVTMAPASARLLADLMLGREPSLDPAPYAPELRIATVRDTIYTLST